VDPSLEAPCKKRPRFDGPGNSLFTRTPHATASEAHPDGECQLPNRSWNMTARWSWE